MKAKTALEILKDNWGQTKTVEGHSLDELFEIVRKGIEPTQADKGKRAIAKILNPLEKYYGDVTFYVKDRDGNYLNVDDIITKNLTVLRECLLDLEKFEEQEEE